MAACRVVLSVDWPDARSYLFSSAMMRTMMNHPRPKQFLVGPLFSYPQSPKNDWRLYSSLLKREERESIEGH